MDWIVVDSRNKNILGPYPEKDAKDLADNLNDFVLRNAGIASNPFKAKEKR